MGYGEGTEERNMIYHTDKNGNKTRIQELETSHLKNIIRWIERKAEEGMTIRRGGGSTAEDIWYDEDDIEGDEVLEHLNYDAYKSELLSRQRNTMTEIEQAEDEFTEWFNEHFSPLIEPERIILKVNGEEVLITDWSLAGPGIVVVTGETKK